MIMQSHQLKTRNTQSRKRVARGGKRGTYSGRGNKGQKARSGGNIDPLFEGGRSSLVERLKKVKGFKSPHAKKVTITLAQLDAKFEDGGEVNIRALVRTGLLDPSRVTRGVKILGTGTLTKKLTIAENILLTASAKEAVEKSGGTLLRANPKKSLRSLGARATAGQGVKSVEGRVQRKGKKK